MMLSLSLPAFLRGLLELKINIQTYKEDVFNYLIKLFISTTKFTINFANFYIN
jgi:hypothetical protein